MRYAHFYELLSTYTSYQRIGNSQNTPMLKTSLLLPQEETDSHPLQVSRNHEVVSIRRCNREKEFKKKRITSDASDTGAPAIIIDHKIEWHEIYQHKYQASQFQTLIQSLKTGDPHLCLMSLVGLRKLISQDHSLGSRLIQQDGLNEVVTLTQMQDYPQIVFEATWCLANLVSYQQVDQGILRDTGIVEVVLKMVEQSEKTHILIFEHAVIALSNISFESQEIRDQMIEKQCISHMLRTLTSESCLPASTLQHTCWAFSNIIRVHHTPPYHKIKKAITYIVCALVDAIQNFTDDSILTDCIFVLAHNINLGVNNLDEMAGMGILPLLIERCQNNPNTGQLIACTRVLGNFTTGSNQIIDRMLQLGLVQALHSNLDHKSEKVRAQVCWVLSNIAACPIDITEKLIRNEKMLTKLAALSFSSINNIRKEVCFLFANLSASMLPRPYFKLVKGIQLIENITGLMDCGDQNLASSALKCLQMILRSFQSSSKQEYLFPLLRILESNQGSEKLQQLTLAEDQKISKEAQQILRKHIRRYRKHLFYGSSNADQLAADSDQEEYEIQSNI